MNPLLTDLTTAAAGLLVISESEAPLQPIELPAGTGLEATLRALAGQPATAPVEIRDAFAFLDHQARLYGSEPAAERIRALAHLLHASLPGLRLYRCGAVQVHAFLLAPSPTAATPASAPCWWKRESSIVNRES